MREYGDVGSIQPPHNILHVRIVRSKAQTLVRIRARGR